MLDNRPLSAVDPELAEIIAGDVQRQRTHIQLIASENFAPLAVLQASGSVLTNKYAEGYPGRRYYEGCHTVDEVENLAIDRAKELFGAEYANVQAHSGSQANMAAYFALLEPGDTILGMRLDQGGHLTHGAGVNFSGKLFDFVHYGLDPATELVDMDDVRKLALEHRPRMIVAGYSAYSRLLDWSAFREVADEVGALLLVDAAHIIGLIAGGAHPNPVPHAHVVTATTHKALRGGRGGLILADEEFGKKINGAVFPFGQGGALFNQIAAKAVAFKVCGTAEYRDYAHQVVRNAATLAETMAAEGLRIVSGGTDNHLFLVDTRSVDEDLTGKAAATLLDGLGITLNRNAIPNDPRSPFVTSGLRIGTPAVTSVGMKQEQMVTIGRLIAAALNQREDEVVRKEVRSTVAELTSAFPPYPADFPGYA